MLQCSEIPILCFLDREENDPREKKDNGTTLRLEVFSLSSSALSALGNRCVRTMAIEPAWRESGRRLALACVHHPRKVLNGSFNALYIEKLSEW